MARDRYRLRLAHGEGNGTLGHWPERRREESNRFGCRGGRRTDQNIRRAGTLCKAGGFTVVKVAKPQQDMRFDVPTVGLRTLESMVEAGAEVLAIEARKTILLDRDEVLRFADKNKLILIAIEEPPT